MKGPGFRLDLDVRGEVRPALFVCDDVIGVDRDVSVEEGVGGRASDEMHRFAWRHEVDEDQVAYLRLLGSSPKVVEDSDSAVLDARSQLFGGGKRSFVTE